MCIKGEEKMRGKMKESAKGNGDLCDLYRNNPFSETEIDSIKKCKRGEAFLITTLQERTSVGFIATRENEQGVLTKRGV